MMSVTHAAIATCTTAIALGTANPWVLTVAAIGSQLPDLDTTESFTGRILWPVARWLEERFPHRTITHSFAASAVLAVVSLPLWFWGWQWWAAVVLGHFCGWFSDCFTKAGVAAFFPSPARLVIPGNPKARLESKSPAEYWILAIAVFLLIATVNIVSAGGITEQFARSFFADSATAADTFKTYGASQQVLIQVEGIHSATSQRVRGQFVVVEATERDVIGEDGMSGRLYKIGTSPDVQIRPTSIKTSLGDRVSIQSEAVQLQEIGVGDWLTRVPQNSYLSGSLALDDMGDVQIPLELESYPVVRVFGGQVELSNARPSQVVQLLGDHWVTSGKVIVKVRG